MSVFLASVCPSLTFYLISCPHRLIRPSDLWVCAFDALIWSLDRWIGKPWYTKSRGPSTGCPDPGTSCLKIWKLIFLFAQKRGTKMYTISLQTQVLAAVLHRPDCGRVFLGLLSFSLPYLWFFRLSIRSSCDQFNNHSVSFSAYFFLQNENKGFFGILLAIFMIWN